MDTANISRPDQRASDFNMEHFRIRLPARLGIVIICFLVFVQRVPALAANSTIPPLSRLIAFINLPFPVLMVFVIAFEYFLSKKMGPDIVKHINKVDLLLLLFFTADWLVFTFANLNKIQHTNPVCFQVGAIFGFTSFSWRTLTLSLRYFVRHFLGKRDVSYLGCIAVEIILFVNESIKFYDNIDPKNTEVIFFFSAFRRKYGTFHDQDLRHVPAAEKGLMVTLIVQKWQLKIIPPAMTVIVMTGFAIHYSPKTIAFTIISASVQLTILIIIMYCEDKVKWKMVWANIQKDKWMQVNNFILNSLPENIMILDLNGETKFISESCQSFIKGHHLSLDTKELFKRIQGLQQQKYEPPAFDSGQTMATMRQIERLTTENELLGDHEDHLNGDKVLEDIVNNFKESIIKKEINEKQFQVYNGKLITENQQERSLEVKISFVLHFENSYIILVIRDTTQRDLLVTLEETNKYKDQLLASVSHELRAPLNGNINLVESAINSPKIPENVKESLLIPALRSSKFLLHMCNDILDMSQIKEKKLRLVFHSESLKETLKSTAQLVELQASKKGVTLLLEIDDPSLPAKFCTDHIRLSQIILNLLNNAIKFTKEGVVKLTAKLIPESSSVKITVEDSGIGMNQESLQKLFSSYTHIEFDGRQDMNPTGVGLGLNIAYSLALLLGPQGHQGITVTSIPGEGSTFAFILENKGEPCLDKSEDFCSETADEFVHPIELMSFPKIKRISSGSSNSIIEKCDSLTLLNHDHNVCTCAKILVVDDNPFNTMACETILDSMNLKCDCVFSGPSCVKTLLKRQDKVCGENCKQYSIIFMDQEMPEMNGNETVYEIKKLQAENLLSQGIKIVGCTAHKSKEEVDRFMEAGLDQCIHKPISPEMLKEVLKGTTVLEK